MNFTWIVGMEFLLLIYENKIKVSPKSSPSGKI